MNENLALHTFGGWQLQRGDETLTTLGSRKVEGLFVYLAINKRAHPRELLAELLWDDRSQKQAMSNLRRILTGLRQNFGDHVAITRETAAVLPNNSLWFDVWELKDRLAPLEDRLTSLSPTIVANAEEGLQLYRGTFMAGFTVRGASGFESWLTSEREHWQQQVLAALRTLSHYYESARLYSKGIAAAQRAIQIDALQESAYQQLMRLLTLSGRRAEALSHYESCRQLLRDELGVTPSPEMEALYAAIVAGELTAVSTEPFPVEEHWSRREENEDPRQHARHDTPHNLPPQATPFIGREAELAALDDLIANPEVRLITIVGPGGMGKTRLALASAERQLETNRFPKGVFFVYLTSLSEVSHIVPAMAEAMDFPLETGDQQRRTPQQQIFDYLRQKKILLLLDNFEHLLNGVEIVADILQVAPGVQILATSRERLHVNEEHVFTIRGFEILDWGTWREAERASSVQLFIQSARHLQHDLTLEEEDIAHLSEILQMVGGMPLAIELAAGWIDMLSLADIATEIQKSLDFLETEIRDIPERHRSMRAVFDASWQRLSEAERNIVSQLSVFRGGFTRQAAQVTTGASLRLLARLVSKSLLQYDRSRDRYHIHELLRQFGAEKLEDGGQQQQTRTAFIRYFLNFLQDVEADIKGGRQLAAIAEIEAELGNIRTAWNWAIQDEKFDLIDRALTALNIYCDRVFNFVAYQELQQQAVTATAPIVNKEPHPLWFRLVSRHLLPRGKEISLVEKALAFARKKGDSAETAYCLAVLGWSMLMTGKLNGVLPLLEEGLALAYESDDPLQTADLLKTQGKYYELSGYADKAVDLYRQVTDLLTAAGDNIYAEKIRFYSSGITLWNQGDYVRAQAEIKRVVTFYKQTGHHSVAANYMQVYLSFLAFLNGDFADAEQLAQAPWQVLSESGDKYYVAHVRNLRGLLAINRKNYSEAAHYFNREVARTEERSETRFLRIWGLAMAALALGDLTSAKQQLQKVIDISLVPPRRGMMILVLPITALFFGQIGVNERATELLALAYRHLAGMTGWVEKLDFFSNLRPKVDDAFDPDRFIDIWQQGEELDLWRTAESLLAELAELG